MEQRICWRNGKQLSENPKELIKKKKTDIFSQPCWKCPICGKITENPSLVFYCDCIREKM